MRLAFLADIHGNWPALEAVCTELERLQPDTVIVNGDLINAVPFSAQVIDYIRSSDWVVVRGNHEFYYLNFGSERDVPESHDRERWGQLHWLVDHLSPEQGRYLATLPDDLTLYFPQTQPIRVAHGVPGHNRRGFYVDQPDDEIVSAIQHVEQSTLISAHSHVQIDRRLSTANLHADDLVGNQHLASLWNSGQQHPRKWHLVNPGSVGIPLNGDVRAQFAILDNPTADTMDGGWKTTFYRVPYDRRPALDSYTSSGMLEEGGVISELFYWELVTAELEVPFFFQWAQERFPNLDRQLRDAFAAYKTATGRDEYIRKRDPLYTDADLT